MNAEGLRRKKRIRQGHRAYCQRIIDDIDGLLSEATLDKDTLLVKTASLDQQREKIKTLDDEIEVLTDEDDLLTEIQEAGECMARYSIVLQRAQKACNSSPGSNDQQHSNSAADKVAQLRQQSNLPRLELPTFSGDVMEFHTFWDLFKSAVHDKHDIADAEKFQYLKAQLKGVALKAINGLRVAADNYTVAVDILLEKYGNTDVIIDAHMLAFVDMKCSGYSYDELEEFRTELETHVRELEALEVQANEYERMLCPVAMEKLPAKAKEHLVRWIGRQTMTLKDLREFLSEEVKTLKAYEPRARRQPRMGVRQKRTTFQARGTDMYCVLCGSQHTQERCQMFQAMSVPQRLAVCREHGLCYRCLGKRHVSRDCTASVVCEVGGCRGAHHTLLHAANREVPLQEEGKPDSSVNSSQREFLPGESSRRNRALATSSPAQSVVFQTVPVVLKAGERSLVVNALLDPCSDASYVSEAAASELHVTGEDCVLNLTTVQGQGTVNMKKTNVSIEGIDGGFRADIAALVTKDLTCTSEVIEWTTVKTRWPHLRDVSFPKVSKRQGVDMLIGVSPQTLSLFVPEETRRGKNDEPAALKTPLGWVAFGPLKKAEGNNCNVSNFARTLRTKVSQMENEDIIQAFDKISDLDWIGVNDRDEKPRSHEDKMAEEKAAASLRFADGRYQIGVPWKDGIPDLQCNYETALSRLEKTENSLKKRGENLGERYNDILEEYQKKGYMKKYSYEDWVMNGGGGWFLPHFPVVREDKSTTKLRIVYDAAATSMGKSLNSEINPGPSLYTDLTEILLRFRQHPVALVGDVAEMFLQVMLPPEDRQYHRVLWRNFEVDRLPDIFEAQRWLFGNAAAPFCTQYVMREHARKNQEQYPIASRVILDNVYMDDALASFMDEDTAMEAQRQLHDLMHEAGMTMRKWLTNSKPVLNAIPENQRAPDVQIHLQQDELPIVKTLGVVWNAESDMFSVSVAADTQPDQKCSKRSCLKKLASVFDPLGFLLPFVIMAKILFQSTWDLKLTWDAEIPGTLRHQWVAWCKSLTRLSQASIPRCLHDFETGKLVKESQLHVFTDASEKAYGAVAYVVTAMKNAVTSRLVMAKARAAPRKKIQTIPRLELVGAVLGLRLAGKVCKALKMPLKSVIFWTDSTDVLCWINNETRKFQTFVANRIAEIRSETKTCQWRHVPGASNPADLASRGCSAEVLMSEITWWKGPNFLITGDWPPQPTLARMDYDCSEFRTERYQQTTLISGSSQPDSHDRLHPGRYSSWKKLLRVTAWIQRFICQLTEAVKKRKEDNSEVKRRNRCRTAKKGNVKHDERRHHSPIAAELTVEEVAKAEKFWVHSAQTDAFENERRELEISQSIQVRQTTPMKQRGKTGKGSRLQGLSPFIDEDQLIRVGGRIGHADLPYDTRHPYVLPKRHAVSALIVRDTHEKFDHEIGIEHNLAELRQKFWIISGREEIKRGIRGCPECKRRRERTGTQIMAPKRREQLKPSYRAFSHCGVDFAGPVETRQGRGRVKAKRYICLFTCFQTRAVHLEMAYGLDTDSFLCAFDRFIAIRGVPEDMWSDDGRNFVSAEKELKKTSDTLDRNKVQKEGVARGIRWHFNPPAAPHFGGAYEALIKSVKRAMYSTLRNTSITDEELQSALCRAEALLNSRPLTPLSTDPSDELPLTPAHFLVGHIRTEVDASLDGARGHLKRWRLVQQMTAVFWKRWQREYVLSLQARTKWRSPQKDLAEGDVVMMADSSVSRGQWPLARVVKVHRGTDGHVRVVDVKCKGKVYKRPVVRLVHLESAPKQD